MKKVMLMAIALMASTMTFAGKSDALKAITKSKDYAEAAQLLKANLSQLADNAEKAEAYNHLVELAMAKVQNETGTIAENQAAAQLRSGKVKEYDTLGLAEGICNAIEMAVECDKYDQMPDAKGKVKPRFAEKNAQRVWAVRANLVNIGQSEAQKGNDAGVLKYWGAFVDSGEMPFFAAQDHQPEQSYLGQVALFAGRYAFQAKDMDRANRYFEVAKRDPEQKADAVTFQLYALRSNLKNRADSLAYVDKLKAMYEQDPKNEAIIDGLYSMYDGMKMKAEQKGFLESILANDPNNFIALADMGVMFIGDNDYKNAIPYLRKAIGVKGDNPSVLYYLGTSLCIVAQEEGTSEADRKNLYKEAVDVYDKCKQLDPNKEQIKWGYNRFNAYYNYYGPDAPETKAAEADK